MNSIKYYSLIDKGDNEEQYIGSKIFCCNKKNKHN